MDSETQKPRPGKKDLEYAKEFWLIGNAVTAFAFLQTITFASVVGPHKSDLFCAITDNQALTIWGILVGSVLLCRASVFLQSHSEQSFRARRTIT